MNSLALTYALLAGLSLATYVIALRLAAPGTHPAHSCFSGSRSAGPSSSRSA